jgi:pimeloyl-ACP methyl ester carboxylesterase
MADRLKSLQVDMLDLKLNERRGSGGDSNKLERHEVVCPVIGPLNVYVQGTRTSNEVVILTVHDIGCDHSMYLEFVEHPKMSAIRSRTVWVHVDVPGQGQDAPDLPTDYQFPTMQQIGEDLIHVLEQLKVREVICFGEGAGANILARFAMAHGQRVLGVCLLHTTGTTIGLLQSLKDKVSSWKLDSFGMNPAAESYLILHRFGTTKFSKASDKEELKAIVEGYQETLRNKANPKNLKKFVEAFLKRTSITENLKNLNCRILLVTGQQSVFNGTTRSMHQSILKTCGDKTKVEFIEVGGVANVLEEKPDNLVECFQYFLQGLGLVSSVPMQNVAKPQRGRSMSMQDYDIPLRKRMNSAQMSSSPPISATPPIIDNGDDSAGSSNPDTPNEQDFNVPAAAAITTN